MGNGAFGRVTAVSLVTTANTVVVSAPGASQGTNLNVDRNAGGAAAITNGPPVQVSGGFNITPGTGTTSANVTCVDEAGVQVDVTQNVPATAAIPNTFYATFLDTRGSNLPHTYTMKVAQVGASANGTINVAWLQTETAG